MSCPRTGHLGCQITVFRVMRRNHRCWHAMRTGKWFCACNFTAAGEDVLPFHANHRDESGRGRRASFALLLRWRADADMRLRPDPGLVIRLTGSLPPIVDRLYFSPTHEDTAEAARSRIAEAQGDLRYALVGFNKQAARRIEAHFRNHVTVAGAHCSEMTLQRARAHPQLDCRAFKCCATVTHRGGNRRPHRIPRRCLNRLHGTEYMW